MTNSNPIRTTPITGRANRQDRRVRLIEESVLVLRGDWPAIASGLCDSVNRAAGLVFLTPATLDGAIDERSRESLRLVEQLYGSQVAAEVERRADIAPTPACGDRDATRPRHRIRLRRHTGAHGSPTPPDPVA
ncbi:MAG: hypothetical protein ACRDPE_01580 [Solirubrobacterales bacterium]